MDNVSIFYLKKKKSVKNVLEVSQTHQQPIQQAHLMS